MQVINQLIIDENNIAFHPMMGNSYQLNTTAKKIITLLRENRTKDEILDIISKEYEISKEELFIDLQDFISKLILYGLIGEAGE